MSGTTTLDPSDEILAERLADGDLSAFDLLLERFGARVRQYLVRLTNDVHVAEDLTQEVFMKALQGVKKRDPSRGFAVWLFRIAHNEAVDYSRKMTTRRRAFEAVAEIAGRETPDGCALAASPLDHVQYSEARHALEAALEALPEAFRGAFLLREAEGLSYEQIAEIMETSPKTVSTRIHRARHRLKELLTVHLGPEAELSAQSEEMLP